MAKWKKPDFWMEAFRDALPVVLSRIWVDGNGKHIDQALETLEPDSVLEATGGSLEMERLSGYLLCRQLQRAVVETVCMMDGGLGAQICKVRHEDSFQMWEQNAIERQLDAQRQQKLGLPAAWREDVFEELQAMVADHIRSSEWWRQNGKRFRQHASSLRAVRKVQES